MPSPPHVSPLLQVPQLVMVRWTPQLSITERLSHSLLFMEQSVISEAGAQQVLLVHTSEPAQPPQETVREAPQRSVTVMEPQSAPAFMHSSVFVSGLHTQLLPEHCCVVALHVFAQD